MTMNEVYGYLNAQWTALAQGFVGIIPQLVAAILVLLITWILSRILTSVMTRVGRRMHLRSNLIEVLDMVGSLGIWLFGFLIALTIVFPTITPGKALTTLGLGSVAIGFAFKDTFENFLAGILILWREPFQLHDFVECEGIDGAVEKITIRDTHIRQTDGQLVVVPNHILFQNPVTVRTSSDLRRITVICGVGYGEDIETARKVIKDAVRQVDSVRDDVKDVQVFAQDFGASSIDFAVSWWTGSRPVDVRRSRAQVITSVKAALDEAGIEIPFPYRTLTFAEPLRIEQEQNPKDEA